MHAPAFTRRAAGGLGLGLLTAGLVALPTTATAASTTLVINEVYVNGGSAGATYTHKYVELHNKTAAAIDLTGMSIQYRSPTGSGSSSSAIPLAGSVPAGGYFTIQGGSNGSNGTAVPGVDQTTSLNPGAGGGTITLASVTTAVDPSTSTAIVDKVGWGTSNAPEGTAATGNSVTKSLSRSSASADTDVNSADFTATDGSPDAATPPVAPPADPVEVTIAEIQGTGSTTPYADDPVITEGVVTAAYPTGGFDGFYIQTGGADTPNASDGVFVYEPDVPATIGIGDSVRVEGVAKEFSGLTEIDATKVTELTTALPPATPRTGPWYTTDAEREAHEGELFDPTGEFTVTNSYNTGQYGEVGLATGTTPLRQPTETEDAQTGNPQAVIDDNNARRVTLDDGKSSNFAGSASGETLSWLDKTHPVRVGASATLKGAFVVDHRNGAYKLQPTSPVTGLGTDVAEFENTRLDNAAPAAVGGDIRIATFNVLNYFPTTGEEYVAQGLGTCTYYTDRAGNRVTVNSCTNNGPRGAAQEDDFERQQAKIVTAINKLDASVVGLEEVENSVQFGLDRDDALSKLVVALNAAAGAGTWDYVRSPAASELPTPAQEDVIRTAFIYKPGDVEPVGVSRVLKDETNFDNAREPLAQAFKAVGARDEDGFGVVVNHFKSKGSACATGNDPLQGNCNADRIGQANALAAFADAFAVERGIDAVFLTGDFNAYTEEDPVQALEAAGYTNVKSDDPDDESYSFQGLSGSLDHVFANAAALELVTGADIWEINGDEAVAYQYGRYNYNATDLFTTDQFAASDHNPEVFGITFPGAEPTLVESRTMAKAKPSRPVFGRDFDLAVKVKAGRVTPDGRVEVLYKGDRIAIGSLEDGRIVFTIKRDFGIGKHTLVVKYLGSDEVEASRDEVRITVVRKR